MKSGNSAARQILPDSARDGVGGFSIAGKAGFIQATLVLLFGWLVRAGIPDKNSLSGIFSSPDSVISVRFNKEAPCMTPCRC
jgi:hypothetical protein